MPVHSNIGTIGTAGPEGLYTQEVADNGGNIDTQIIKKGSKILLPVFTQGALLAMGDVHAAMGDGEVNGMGVEIGAEIEVTVRLRKDLKNRRPIVIYDNRVACIASNPDVLKAINQVLKDIGKYLVDVCGYNKKDASTLIAFYGNLRFCQVVNPQKTVRIEIDKQYMNLFKHKSLPF
jgi:amidase